ncbi:DUF4411 domain-containing protein [Adhaeribacter arboris]|uniref:DUF4411 domain-containing protein n=1 Tax=Adhaeribacter arboris TaxID=2072846 RepID=A0A2T2YHW8_9BACT|nr:DUF4411 family protein [Adhaeribacter arboris]PSR55101.1 DUF4411 domain-containing protein [Adhaeribacter arboris]
MGIYVVDSNFFIQAHRSVYPLDIAVGFWEKVKQLAHDGKIISIDKVKNEIYPNGDLLSNWCKDNLPKNFFRDTTEVLTAYAQIVNWIESKRTHYSPAAITEFLGEDEADAWLIAYALTNSVTIITHEVSDPSSKRRIKIPDVCLPRGVRFINTIDMFRELGERF